MTSEPVNKSLSRRPHAAPQILERAGDLLERYDVVFCDVWGVVHDGHRAFAAACDALTRFRTRGGTVVLVSNAPVPNEQVAAMLDVRAVPRSSWDAIVSSGDIALARVAAERYGHVLCIGPQDRDAALFTRLTASPVSIEKAEAIVCSGLRDDRTETAESYLPLLETALRRELPFVCANPDLVVDVGGRLFLCAGAIADLYQGLGGPVFWAGKPHASAYAAAHAVAERLRDESIVRTRILAIGDAVRTDLAAAQNAGIDALLVASGIHRHEIMDGARIAPDKLAYLLAPPAPGAIAAMPALKW